MNFLGRHQQYNIGLVLNTLTSFLIRFHDNASAWFKTTGIKDDAMALFMCVSVVSVLITTMITNGKPTLI